uniref:Archaeal enzymes of ATP-grasp superfamily n=1 Tax=uncultured marine thaumarchaeote KM3_10_C07 TaxID=1455986 RepID=A0A075G5Z0_9ARCH|nr:Archaeal enzymes of ATP-grasp superfamily [uncultured marine thaumarchaeote KM3_10_C07]
MISAKLLPEDLDVNGLSLVTGFHGIGSTGFLALNHLINTLKPKRIGVFETDYLSPISSINSGKIITPFEIYQKDNVAFLRVAVPPLQGNELVFLRNVCEIILEKNFKELILLGGLDAQLKKDDSNFRYVKTSSYKLPKSLSDSTPLEDERIIIGPVAQMLNFMEVRNFPTLGLLPFATSIRLDPRAASEAVKILSNIFNLEVEIDTLIEQALELENDQPELVDNNKSGPSNIYS